MLGSSRTTYLMYTASLANRPVSAAKKLIRTLRRPLKHFDALPSSGSGCSIDAYASLEPFLKYQLPLLILEVRRILAIYLT
jgi:hypothetical protein